MLSYSYLLDLAMILLATKIFGIITKRVHLPQVVGALMAGLILGPSMLNLLRETDFLKMLAELGVIVLMFSAGMDTDLRELKQTGKASFIIALLGVIVPLAGGFFVGFLFNDANADGLAVLENIFLGVVLTATSVSITVETLKELGKLNTKAGNTILGAALIDDVLGIVALTVISSLADKEVELLPVLLRIFGFFVFAGVVGIVFHKAYAAWSAGFNHNHQRFVVIAFALCLGMAFVAEYVFGVADITGAFIAGLIIANTPRTKYVSSRFNTLSYILLSPVFFASIGLSVIIPNMDARIVILTLVLIAVALITKIAGCGFGAKFSGFTNIEAIQIGTGMVSRGEVALIVASKGLALGLMTELFFGPVVVMVIFTTIITPILLKIVFTRSKDETPVESVLISQYEAVAAMEKASQDLADFHYTNTRTRRKS